MLRSLGETASDQSLSARVHSKYACILFERMEEPTLRPLLTVIRFSSIDAVLPQSVAQIVHRQDNLALVLLVALIRSDRPKSSHNVSTPE